MVGLGRLRVPNYPGRVVDIAYGGEEEEPERAEDAERADEERRAQPEDAPEDAPEHRS